MKVSKKTTKIIKKMAVASAKIACGTASLNGFCQPEEPKNIKKMFQNKK